MNLSFTLGDLKRICAYLAVIFAFSGSELILVKVGGFPITPLRIIGIFSVVLFIFDIGKNKKIKKYKVYFICLFLIALFSVAYSPNFLKSLMTLINIVLFFCPFFCVVDSIKTKDDLISYIKVYLLGIIITILISFFEYFSGIHVANNYTSTGLYSSDIVAFLLKAPTAYLFNPNNVGAFMLTGIPICLLLTKLVHKKKGTILIYCIICLIVMTIFMTGSRGALLIGIFIVVYRKIFQKGNPIKIISFILLSLIFVYIQRDFFIAQLEYAGILKSGALVLSGKLDGGRFEILELVWENIIRISPLVGLGVGSVEIVTNNYAHNFLVEILANIGLIGLIYVLFGFVKLFSYYLKTTKKLYKVFFENELIVIFSVMVLCPSVLTISFIWMILAFLVAYRAIDWSVAK